MTSVYPTDSDNQEAPPLNPKQPPDSDTHKQEAPPPYPTQPPDASNPGAPPPYPTQPPAPAQYNQMTAVVMTQPMATVVLHFREAPVRTNCQHCLTDIVTAISYETGTFTWIACAVVCIIGCDLGCCFIPFCLNSCKDVVHKCPSCHKVVGKYNRM